MSDLSATREVFRLQLEDLKKGDNSPDKVKAYTQYLELIDSSGTVEEWKKKMTEQGVFDLYGRAVISDKYRVMAEVFRKTYYGEKVADAFISAADAIINDEGETAVNAAIEKATELKNSMTRTLQYINHALMLIIEYDTTSDYFTHEKKTILEKFNQNIDFSGGFHAFKELLESETIVSALPYEKGMIAELITTAQSMTTARLKEEDPDAEEMQWAQTQKNILINSKGQAAQQAEKTCREKTTNRLFSVHKKGEEPGPYDFELLWEKTGGAS